MVAAPSHPLSRVTPLSLGDARSASVALECELAEQHQDLDPGWHFCLALLTDWDVSDHFLHRLSYH